MNKWKTLVLLLTVTLIGCSKSPPPTAGGKPVEHWLAEHRSADPQARVTAVEKLGNIGTKHSSALPAVVESLKDADPSVRKTAIYAVVRNRSVWSTASPVLAKLKSEDPDEEIRKMANEAHGNISK